MRDGDMWVINGRKRWNSQVARAHANLVFARTSGKPGEAKGITAFIVPTDTPGHNVLYNHWTFNMPSDHAETELKDVRVPDSAILHKEGEGLVVAQRFVHENRIRQAAASAGAARYCIQEAVKYAQDARRFRRAAGEEAGDPVPARRALGRISRWCGTIIFRTAWQMDRQNPLEISDMVSICNFRANRLCCEAADRAMQVHGGMGYSRALPFEHIYRHHRRYRITEGTEEVQIRRVAQYLFGFGGKQREPCRMNAVDPHAAASISTSIALDDLSARTGSAVGGTDAGRAHAGRHVEPDLLPHARRLARGAAQAAERRACPSAHAIDREFRVLEALQGTPVPTPKPYPLLRRPRGARHAVLSDGMARRPGVP